MSISRFDRFLPLAGVLAGLFFVLASALTWGAPDTTDADELAAWVSGHETRALLSAAALAYLAVLLAFFSVALRLAIRSGEPGESTYSSVAFAGGLMVSVASALWAFLNMATLSAVNDDDAAAVETMAHLSSLSWLPWLVGSAVLFLAVGIGGLRTAALPRWLAIATLVLAVLALSGPGGIVVYFISPVWLVVTGVVLYARLTAGPAAAQSVDTSPRVHA